MKRIKLFEQFINESTSNIQVVDFQEAENTLTDKEGIVISGVKGNIVDIEDSISGIDCDEAYVLVTDNSNGDPSSWTSDVFLVGGTKEGAQTIKEYFN